MGGNSSSMIQVRRADTPSGHRGKGRTVGGREREPTTNITEHLLWVVHCVRGFRSPFQSLTTNQPCGHLCPHLIEEETGFERDDVTLYSGRGFKISFSDSKSDADSGIRKILMR